jgi:cation:H+ antiporter
MMSVLIDILLFAVGLVAIIKGADWLTDGAAAVARRYGIPSIVVGLTIVAIGSSAPELVVSVVSALNGNVDIALGNVVGSNIFNILAIIGITAVMHPIEVDRRNVRYDVPFVVLSSVVLVIAAFDSLFMPEAQTDSICRTDGLLFLCLFVVFMYYSLSAVGQAPGEDKGNKQVYDSQQAGNTRKILMSLAQIVVGLALLVFGGDWMVDGASGIATALGVSQSIIALTIVSIGTSAPELAASVMAAHKGDTAMALGNVVGSVVFNVLLILGISATICPLGIGGITYVDIMVLLAASALLWISSAWGKKHYTITRTEGSLYIVSIIAYYIYLILNV